MKLITKTGLNFISASVFFFLCGSLGGYYFIRYAVNKSLNSELHEAKIVIDKNWDNKEYNLTYLDVLVDTIKGPLFYQDPVLNDTAIVNAKTGKYELFRKLTFDREVKGHTIRNSIIRPSAPYDLLVMKFTFMLAIFPVLFFLILYLVNRASTRYSLSVFYDTINKLKSFDVNKDNKLQLMTSDIDEFEQLNEVFNAMDKKIKEDFERLKEYTENTSHELQTPLAIIISKLDELLQSPNLKEEEIKSIAGLIETANRLSKINQALIYLAKLDNRMFSDEEEIDLIELVRDQLELLEPMIEDKSINVEVISSGKCRYVMNKSLADTLIQNLLKNAIRYNLKNGYIKIDCSECKLNIVNSGKPLDISPEELFVRFKRAGNHPQSLGIGLSVVKRICDISNIEIQYTSEGNEHRFKLGFR